METNLYSPEKGTLSIYEEAKGKTYYGLAYKGPIPKFNRRDNTSIMEVFLYGFRGNLYHQYLKVSLIEFVRKPKKVSDISQLEEMIREDRKYV